MKDGMNGRENERRKEGIKDCVCQIDNKRIEGMPTPPFGDLT